MFFDGNHPAVFSITSLGECSLNSERLLAWELMGCWDGFEVFANGRRAV